MSDSPHDIANAFFESEAAMWLVAGANHPDTWLSDLRKAYDAWKGAGGMGPAERMRRTPQRPTYGDLAHAVRLVASEVIRDCGAGAGLGYATAEVPADVLDTVDDLAKRLGRNIDSEKGQQ